jgi:hypothetical protein
MKRIDILLAIRLPFEAAVDHDVCMHMSSWEDNLTKRDLLQVARKRLLESNKNHVRQVCRWVLSHTDP